MKIKRIISAILVLSMMTVCGVIGAGAEELRNETFDMTNVKADGDNGIEFSKEIPNGDYTVTVKTGGITETNANIYINGGERVRAYTLNAGETQDNEQPVVVTDGKITVNILGENPNVTEIDIKEIPKREQGEKPTIYIAGDSTAQTYDYAKVYPQTGWGQVFNECFNDGVIIENRSMGGRSSKSYNNDGRLDKILTELKPGDYVFIQFGINDGAENKPERYISVEDYKKLITDKYIGETIKRGGIPVLLTATSASWWDEENNCFMESRADYADPTRELAKETGVKFIDINRIMTDTWNTLDKNTVLSYYFICEPLESKAYPTGTDDHTHLKLNGAKEIASLVANGISDNIPELAKYLKGKVSYTDISGNWAEDTIKKMSDSSIVNGVSGTEFNPEKEVTRAEFLKMIMETLDINGHAYRDGECLDAKNDDWYCYYLQSALDKELIPNKMITNLTKEVVTKELAKATETADAVTREVTVYKTGEFNGNTPITREEMVAMSQYILLKTIDNDFDALKFPHDGAKYTDFKDKAQIDELNYGMLIDESCSLGIVKGNPDGTFAPKSNVTRAEAVTFIERIYDSVK